MTTRMISPLGYRGSGRAMRVPRRSGLLRTTPIFVVVALREPAAIARSFA